MILYPYIISSHPFWECFLVLSPLYWEDLTFIFSFIDCFAFRQLYCFLTLFRHIPWDTPSILSPLYWDDLIFIFSSTDSFALRQWYCILTTSRHTPFGMLPRFGRLSTERTWLYPFLYILFCFLGNDIVSLHHLVTSLLGVLPRFVASLLRRLDFYLFLYRLLCF